MPIPPVSHLPAPHLFAATCALLAVATFTTPAHASEFKVDAALFGGYARLPTQSELGNAVHINLPDDVPQSGPMVGARGSVWLTNQLGADGEATLTYSSLRRTGDSVRVLSLRAAGVMRLMPEMPVSALVRAGFASVTLPSTVAGAEADTDTWALLGVGVEAWITAFIGVRLDVVWLPAPSGTGTLSHAFEIQLAPTFRAVDLADADKDGIPDRHDKCRRQPEDKDGFEDEDGCPDPDNDQDGRADAADRCPLQAEDIDGFEDGDGCPDPDNDKDGIPDAIDKCPKEPENKNNHQDEDGCPDDLDTDKDGVGDSKDKCPDKLENKNGFEDDDGCPDAGDTDMDGIGDDKDKCPTKAETVNGYKDTDGCPDKARKKKKK